MAKANLKNIHRLISTASIQQPVNESFVADLKAGIAMIDAASRREPSKCYKPSSMACIRNMYFQVTGTKPDASDMSCELIGICETGSDRHERLQNYVLNLKQFSIDCEYINVAEYVKEKGLDYLEIVKYPDFEKGEFETKLYHKGLNISFLCDGIIKYKGKYYILEIKTESARKWNDRVGVDESHYQQGTTYSLCLGIDEVMFLYENRDNCGKKAYLFIVTDEMRMEIVSKIEECDGYVNRLVPPPIPLDVAKKTCSYCNYKTSCKKAGK